MSADAGRKQNFFQNAHFFNFLLGLFLLINYSLNVNFLTMAYFQVNNNAVLLILF